MILPSYFFSPQMEFPDTNFTMILLEILSPHLLIFFWIRCKGQGTSEAPTRVFFTVWNCPSKPVFLSPTPHNQYCCYSREWLLFLKIFVCSPLRFSPFISLDKMLKSFFSQHKMRILFHIILIVINWLIHNRKIIRQNFFRRDVPMISMQMGPYAMMSPGSKEQGNVMQT